VFHVYENMKYNVDKSNCNIMFSFSFDIPDDRAGTYVEGLEKVISGKDPRLIMCVIPNNRLDRYSAIKKKCCVDRAGEFCAVLL